MIQTRMGDIHEEFFKAVRAGDTKMINELLNCGADIHFMDDYALRLSIRSNMLNISELLLDRGANVNIKTGSCAGSGSPLVRAICDENLELLDMLLKYNVDVNTENGVALRFGANTRNKHKHAEMIAKLLEHGADVRCNDKSILIDLEKNFNEEIADVLLPYCEVEDYCYFPDSYIREQVIPTKGARNI